MNQTNWLRELFEAALIGVCVFVAIQVAVANFRVEGSSMRPTLLPGHYLMVNKMVYHRLDTERLGKIVPFWQPAEPRMIHSIRPPQRGDVIVFNYPLEPDRQFVKRIIGEPGDLVAIDDGQVRVNDRLLDEPYLDFLGHTHMHGVQLASDEYFVLGDNRTGSRDSRHWGPLPADHIIGKVWAIYWPRSAWGLPK